MFIVEKLGWEIELGIEPFLSRFCRCNAIVAILWRGKITLS